MRTINSNIWKKISDAEYIAGLKVADNHITESFFDGLCNYLLNDSRYSLMEGNVDYDELVNELFIYLSKDNWHKLDTFAGINGCSLCSWVTRITWRYFFKQREHLLGKGELDINDTDTAYSSTDISIDDVKFSDGEVQDVKWATLDDILRMIDTGEFIKYHKSLIRYIFECRNDRGGLKNK